MKILHATDLHMNSNAHIWIEKNHNKVDAVCLSGDFIDDRGKQGLQAQVDFYLKWFETIKVPIFVCSGNHDLDSENRATWLSDSNLPDTVYGDGSITTVNGVIIGCVGYHEDDFAPYTNCDVILYHVPPAKCSAAKTKGMDYGDQSIRWALKNNIISPSYILCGHVHSPIKTKCRLKNTIVVNAGGIHKNNVASHAEIDVF